VTNVNMMPLIERIWLDLRTQPSRWILGVLLFFMFFPSFDIWISAQFYQPGVGFTWDQGGVLEFVRRAIPVMILGSFVFCVVLWVAGIWYEQWFWGMTTNRAIYLMSTLIIGPGLLVESLLKPNWGRARPKELTIFGGQADYTPPFWIANECERNCSFVSGHAAIAFWLSAYGFMLPPKWRMAGVAGGLTFGAVVGWVRIVQGGHFLSDVVFAGLIVISVNVLLYRLVILREASKEHLP
jgi:lipid A 4'-phosphatase